MVRVLGGYRGRRGPRLTMEDCNLSFRFIKQKRKYRCTKERHKYMYMFGHV